MMPSCQIFFRISTEKQILKGTFQGVDGKDKEEIPKTRDAILCRECRRIITYPEERIEVTGSYHHTFANPHGIVFEIGCFKSAEGCVHFGVPTHDFSWFKGFQWRLSACGFCLIHLGWIYTRPEATTFYGLILDRLIFPS
jgi:hypothetical protein